MSFTVNAQNLYTLQDGYFQRDLRQKPINTSIINLKLK